MNAFVPGTLSSVTWYWISGHATISKIATDFDKESTVTLSNIGYSIPVLLILITPFIS